MITSHTIATRARGTSWLPRSRHVSAGVFTLAAVAYAGVVGYLAIHDRRLAIGAAVVGLALGTIASNIARLAIVATAGVWLIARVPGNISVTDVLVALAGLAALCREQHDRSIRVDA